MKKTVDIMDYCNKLFAADLFAGGMISGALVMIAISNNCTDSAHAPKQYSYLASALKYAAVGGCKR